MSEIEIDVPIVDNSSKNENTKSADYRAVGMSLGLMFGSSMALMMIAFGQPIFGMFFMPIGMSLGMVIGSSVKKEK